MVIQQAVYSAEELWTLSGQAEYSEKRLELSEGELIVMSPAGGEHGWITHLFSLSIGIFVKEHQLGYVTAAETGYILYKNPDGKDTVRAPDIGFIAKSRLSNGIPKGFIPTPPDLAVEVVSPNDESEAIQSKLNDYLKYNVPMVIFCYPKTKTMNVHHKGTMTILRIGDTLDGADVLPGFKLPIKDIFEQA